MAGQNTIDQATAAGAVSTVGELFRDSAALHSTRVAIEFRDQRISYGELHDRVGRAAAMLAGRGLRRGDRVALLSRNRPEYLEMELAAASLGVILACLNWRLSARELSYCIELVSPALLIVEADLAAGLASTPAASRPAIEIGPQYERLLAQQDGPVDATEVQPEDGLVILYTSGTTGLPKGAVISHRAMIMRAMVFASELGIAPHDTFVAWAPLFHMASTDHSLATLLRGGTVVVIDGFQLEPLLEVVARHQIGWLVLIQGWSKPLSKG